MAVDRLNLMRAASAYQSIKPAGAGAAPAARPAGGTESFADLLGRAVGGVADSGRKADALRTAAAQGARPNLVEVVTAVAESEAALETLVATRDKIVQAYDEIMRMPI
jgi:flagellar hook-basal body complex protein FliE